MYNSGCLDIALQSLASLNPEIIRFSLGILTKLASISEVSDEIVQEKVIVVISDLLIVKLLVVFVCILAERFVGF